MGQVFISYAREDKDFIDRLVRDVEASELDVWVDRTDIRGGVGWGAAISRAIRECSAFLLALSPDSSNSRSVVKEVCLAEEYEKQIIPLILRPCEISEEMTYPLAGRQRIDFAEDYAEGLRRLLDALGREHTPPSAPPEQPPPVAEEPRPAPDVHFPTETAPPPPPRPLHLAEVLPGQWAVTITAPMMYPMNLMLWLAPDGSFRAQLPTGGAGQGGWTVNHGVQVYMQGVETFGMMSRPLLMLFNVTQFDGYNVAGLGPRGEHVMWRRAG